VHVQLIHRAIVEFAYDCFVSHFSNFRAAQL
jgi:hypothetical protein